MPIDCFVPQYKQTHVHLSSLFTVILYEKPRCFFLITSISNWSTNLYTIIVPLELLRSDALPSPPYSAGNRTRDLLIENDLD